jgi:hypothetical protein
MKLILSFISLCFINTIFFRKNEIGKFYNYSLANGVLHDGDIERYEINENAEKQGNIGIVYISNKLKDEPLGKMRIEAEGIKLLYPGDYNRKNYQIDNEKEDIIDKVLRNKIKFEYDTLKESIVNSWKNGYKDIYDVESKMDLYKYDDQYKKSLLEKIVSKEDELYRKFY